MSLRQTKQPNRSEVSQVNYPEHAESSDYWEESVELEAESRQSLDQSEERQGRPSDGYRTTWVSTEGQVSADARVSNKNLWCLNADAPHPSGWNIAGQNGQRISEKRAFQVSVTYCTLDQKGALPDYLDERTVRDEVETHNLDPSTVRHLGGYAYVALVVICERLNLSDEDKLALVKNEPAECRWTGLVEGVEELSSATTRDTNGDTVPRYATSRSKFVRELLSHLEGDR